MQKSKPGQQALQLPLLVGSKVHHFPQNRTSSGRLNPHDFDHSRAFSNAVQLFV